MKLTLRVAHESRNAPRLPVSARQLIAALLSITVISCAGTKPANLGVQDGRLALCPSSPNCVSSTDARTAHRIPPFQPAAPPAGAWDAVRAAVRSLPRTRIITETDNYLHAECRSQFFGFVDDLELHLRPSDSLIAVRSAARLGYSDFGVNRERVEQLRVLLRQRKTIL